jgi:predicted O-linked N-acetylglucosamine transferase (SPINDLY family)
VARCASSLLSAVGLPELIVKTEQEYEELSLKLATNKKLLSTITEKLEKNRLTTPLFDTKRYTQYLEQAFEKAYKLYAKGNSPQNIWIQDKNR